MNFQKLLYVDDIQHRVSQITCPGIKEDVRRERDQTSSHSVHRIVAIFHKTLHRLVSFYCIAQKNIMKTLY